MTLLASSRQSSQHSSEFVDSVLDLRPEVAAFDCDGTLWSGDAGENFFAWELTEHLVSEEISNWARARYADYQLGIVSEEDMCGEMVALHYGLSESLIQAAADQFFEQYFAAQIFPEMKRLVARLQQQGCEVWAVSSTNEWLIRAGMRHLGVAENRILATAVEIDNGVITNRLLRVPCGEGKPQVLRGVLKAPLNAAFGNSKWDVAMLDMATHAFAVNPNSDLEQLARQRGWRIFFPD